MKDLAGGLSAWDNGCSGSSAKIVDDGVDSSVVSIAGDDIERVSGKAHPGGSAFPVAEVTGDEDGAFAFGEGLVEIFTTDDGGCCFEVRLRSVGTGEEVGGCSTEVDEDILGDLLYFRLRFFRKCESEIIDGFLSTFSGEFPHESAVFFAEFFDLLRVFAPDATEHKIHKCFGDFTEEFFLF